MPQPLSVAIVLFEGFETLDAMGPLEMFSCYPDTFRLVQVAEKAGPVTSAQGTAAVASEGFAQPMRHDMLLVPGGPGARVEAENGVMLDWLRAQATDATYVTSVCTGSLILGKAGLLDGLKATTNKIAFDSVASECPGVDWVRQARWVEAGKFWTSSGVSAGMDMSLALIAHYLGRKAAEKAAVWTEYMWNDDPNNDPFAEAFA